MSANSLIVSGNDEVPKERMASEEETMKLDGKKEQETFSHFLRSSSRLLCKSLSL
jgi:hypothetical protein